MSEPHPTSDTTPSPSGRETNGRFAKGNQFGPGNPFARQCAAFRAALMEAVTEQDIKDIAVKLRDDAKAGDKAAVKLLFQYVIGKPQPAVDPDTLDGQEMRAYAANALPSEALEELQRRLPLGALLPFWPIFLAAKEQQCVNDLSDGLADADAKDARRAARAQRKAERRRRRQEVRQHASAPPSPNGHFPENGSASADDAPSPNGGFGDPTLAMIFHWLQRQRGLSNGDAHS